ncbi:DUF4843 domain-containing protein [Flavivirga rizhaonensis]|uniref:DUF4843 domain-containing protein n=1 Tax=Flavivirga rizhaonensis TaxID=2559571 RepID=A0A4S1DVC4_9FLAO|nr:DUF4843 domain-containing protein [Flavivirga rizhaonensis]TGV02046.1 DUF4843 domain-containing protein [Flavivirga rizhaonensis]
MKNIIKSITLLIVMGLSITSCILDDDNLADTFNDGSNFVSFSTLAQNLSAVADDSEYEFPINVELQGPSIDAVNEDLTVTVEPVASATSTAIEGVHYRLDSKTVTINKDQNYIGAIPITVITQGIIAPLQVQLEVSITTTSGNGNTISNSKNTILTFVYQCFADLSGTYLVTNDGCSDFVPFLTTIEARGGDWFVTVGDGGFLGYGCTGNPGLNNAATITELCGEILPTGNLDYGGLGIGNITGGTWDAVNGVLTMDHVQSFTGNWAPSWTSTYTRQ